MKPDCTCHERHDLVKELLQRGEKEQARAEAIKIETESVRIQALVLIERSHKIA